MNHRRNDAAQPRTHSPTQNASNNGVSDAPSRRLPEDHPTEQVDSSSESLARSLRVPRHGMQSLQRLLDTVQRGSTDSSSGSGANNENGSFMERTGATIQAIETRARALERRHRDFQAELDMEQNRIRRRERTEVNEVATSTTRSPGRTPTVDRSIRPPQIPLDTNSPRTRDHGASGIESTTTALRSNVGFPSMRSIEWLRRNQAHANQEYERYRNEFLERRERLLQTGSDNDLPRNHHPANSGAIPDANPTMTTETGNASGVIERSASARRDLERALRDYRIARRALRNHYNNEPESATDQTNSSPQTTMAQVTDQRDRHRIRARGHTRSNTLEHSDMIANGIAAAAGVNADAWRSDDDETSTDLAARFMELQRRMGREAREPSPVLYPPHVSATRGTTARLPYLGPTTTTGQGGISSGGMRDHYQRLQERRGSGRVYNSPRPAVPGPEPSIETSAAPTTRQRRRPENDRYQRLNETIDRFSDTLFRLQDRTPTLATTSYKSKAKKALKYLSLLHGLGNDSDKSADWAKELGFRSLIESLAKEIEVDLPLRIDELPTPQFSSWLESGMTWTGYQKGGYGKPDNWYSSTMGGLASGPLFESGGASEDRVFQLRALRHRERVRIERLERERSERGVRTIWQNNGLLSGLNNGIETLADVERHLSNLLQEEERRLDPDRRDAWYSPSANTSIGSVTQSAGTDKEQHDDRWPVKVTLHEVNWQDMKVFGTMVASHISGRPTPASNAHSEVSTNAIINEPYETQAGDTTNMETFFDGEIIDFRTHQLETVVGKPGYRVGGLENDVKYWSRIGPFREVIDRNVQRLKDEKAKDLHSGLGPSKQSTKQRDETAGTNTQDTREYIDQADIDSIVDETMADCLGSRRWLEKALGEGGWMLMRWKERCFVKPPSSASSATQNTNQNSTTGPPNPTRSFLNGHTDSPYENNLTTSTYTTMYSDSGNRVSTSWGLTIRGFYYVAVHRLTGRIEALYYDSGSQPFQELRMRPYVVDREHGGEIQQKMNEKRALGTDDVGVRSEFGVFEFR